MQPEYPELEPAEKRHRNRVETPLWLIAFAALSLWVLWRLDAFDFATSVTINGRSYLNGFATVDHPFHTMRAYQLIESVRDGHPLRWITSHQGGYPVEFYPIGVAWLEVGVWALSFGSLSIFAVHKLTILLIFLLPGVGFWVLSRGDRKSPAAGFLALALQVGIAGYWMSGGFTELVSWGLVTNVTGATAALIATGALARFAIRGESGMALLSIGAITLSAYANPRSLIAVGVAGVAVVLSSLLASNVGRQSLKTILVRIGSVALIASLTSATEIVSLIRYRDLYYFVNYEQYNAEKTYWAATVNAMTTPVIWLAVGGAVWALLSRRFPVARVAAIALGLYVLVTLALAGTFGDFDLIQQLESPRLMPYQRMLMLFLAAFFVVRLFDIGANILRVGSERGLAVVATAIIVLVVFIRPVGDIGPNFQGLVEEPLMSTSEMDTFRDTVRQADAAAPEGTAILILGTGYSWHERLWASLDTDKPLYYEHWLWGWNNQHAGPPSLPNGDCPFDNDLGNSYPCPDQTLTEEYLSAHGIGAVMVTNVRGQANSGDSRKTAASSRLLSQVSTSQSWDVYAVNSGSALVTNGDIQPTSVDVENESITASFTDGSGDILIRVNWFPRWHATVNGESVDVQRGPGGYMTINAPAGAADVKLTYAMTTLDWVTRIAAIVGVIATVGLWLIGRRGSIPWLTPNSGSVHR